MMVQSSWLSVLVAALAGFVVGGLWYGPLLGKAWMKARAMTDADRPQGGAMARIFGLTFVLNLVSAAFLGHLLAHFPDLAARVRMMIATGVALGFIVPALWVNYLFSRVSRALYFIDGGYWIVAYAAMGAVFVMLG